MAGGLRTHDATHINDRSSFVSWGGRGGGWGQEGTRCSGIGDGLTTPAQSPPSGGGGGGGGRALLERRRGVGEGV